MKQITIVMLILVLVTVVMVKFFVKMLPYLLIITACLLVVGYLNNKFLKEPTKKSEDEEVKSAERDVEVKVINENASISDRLNKLKS